MFRRLLIPIILVILCLPGLALAEQIANVTESLGQGNAFILTDPGVAGGTETLTADVPVTFSFSTDLGIDWVPQDVAATLTLYAASTTAGGSLGGSDVQPDFSGSFSIVSAVYGDLLSGTFAGQATSASGQDEGNGLTLYGSDTTKYPTEVTFASSYLNFSYYTETEVMSFALSNLLSPLSLDSNNYLSSNNGAGVGTFSASPTPPVIAAEPETLLLSGALLLLMGRALRKRKLQQIL